MKINIRDILLFILVGLCAFTILTRPSEIVKTETTREVNIEHIKDSIKSALIKNIKPIYIDTSKTKIKYIKGKDSLIYKDSIVYVKQPNENTIKANKVSAKLESNGATADLDIVTTGEILDIKGTINYPKETITEKTTNTLLKSNLFVGPEVDFAPPSQILNTSIKVYYQHKDKWLVNGGVGYSLVNNQVFYSFGLGFRF